MSTLISYGEEVHTIFQLMGAQENDITKSIGWTLNKCPIFLKGFIREFFETSTNPEEVLIFFQKFETNKGITDIEITDNANFYLIIEAKVGWQLPLEPQLLMYSKRKEFQESQARSKLLVTMSECSETYADCYLPVKEVKGVPIKHLSWRRLYDIVCESKQGSNNAEKLLLEELKEYLRGIMTMQSKESNWVYVVSLGSDKPDGCDITWIEIVTKCSKYFHPIGGKGGWPKTPPNYIAFRYDGKLQSIHHIEEYDVTRNMHDKIPEMSSEVWDDNYFVYQLGPAIRPDHVVKQGHIYPSGRVWAMLDTLLTANSISEARDISKER